MWLDIKSKKITGAVQYLGEVGFQGASDEITNIVTPF